MLGFGNMLRPYLCLYQHGCLYSKQQHARQKDCSVGMVVHACDLSIWEAAAGESGVRASLGFTVRPYLQIIKEGKRER